MGVSESIDQSVAARSAGVALVGALCAALGWNLRRFRHGRRCFWWVPGFLRSDPRRLGRFELLYFGWAAVLVLGAVGIALFA